MIKKYHLTFLPTFIVSIVFSSCYYKSSQPKFKEFYLNTDSLKSASNEFINGEYGNAVIAAYLCDKKNIRGDSVPWADVFVCKFFKDVTYLKTDTVVFFDTCLRKSNSGTNYSIYWADVKPAQKLKKCKIFIPLNQLNNIKRFKYKYGSVSLVTDD
jgi:hypothetical protein